MTSTSINLCGRCGRHDDCTALCSAVSNYANQDFVFLKEVPFAEVPSSTCLLATRSREEVIIQEIFFSHKTHREVADMIGVSRQYVTKVSGKYRKILIENLKK